MCSATRTSIAFFSMPLLRDLWFIFEEVCPLLKEQQAMIARKSRKVRNTSQRTTIPFLALEAPSDCFIPQSLIACILSKCNMYDIRPYIDPHLEINVSSQLDNYKHAITTMRYRINIQYLIIIKS